MTESGHQDELTGVSVKHNAGDLVLPGTEVAVVMPPPAGATKRAVVRLGGGLSQRGRSLHGSKVGQLRMDAKRNKLWISGNQRRYVPVMDDMVIGVVIERHSDEYRLSINATDTATLSALAFEGATKKNKPNLLVGALVFCRVIRASRNMEAEVSCVEVGSTKSWLGGETLFGELKHGMVVRVSMALAHELPRGCPVLKVLGDRVPFESAVGANGRVWIRAGTVANTIKLCEAIKKADVMEKDEWYKLANALLSKER